MSNSQPGDVADTWTSSAARILTPEGREKDDALPLHPQMIKDKIDEYDVFIAGSGPIGATYARILVEAGFNVCMVDVGNEDSPKRGSHKKNNVVFQKEVNGFINIIRGSLTPVSIPSGAAPAYTLSPRAFRGSAPYVQGGKNPDQKAMYNLPGQQVARVVGGTATLWTCAVPRFTGKELPMILPISGDTPTEEEIKANERAWDPLYTEAEKFMIRDKEKFTESSIRHHLIRNALLEHLDYAARPFQQIPLAVKVTPGTAVEWSSAHTVFDMADRKTATERFVLLSTTLCARLRVKKGLDSQKGSEPDIEYAVVRDVQSGTKYRIKAKVFIMAAGAILNPQIVAASGFANFGQDQTNSRMPNLGHYISEQTLVFCQTVFNSELIDKVTYDLIFSGTRGTKDFKIEIRQEAECENPDWWNKKVVAHMMKHQEDPIPIPFDDPEPMVTTLFSEDRPWHPQIQRDAFGNGAVTGGSIDERLIVDWRFFGRTQPEKSNQLFFSNKYKDAYGMPQPTFHYEIKPDSQTAKEAERMMADMMKMSTVLGGFLPGSYPQYMPPGFALHIGGTHRAGLDRGTSVVDVDSKVWGFNNLFLGSCGNIPTAYASNPTLTAMAYAVKSCAYIKDKFEKSANPLAELELICIEFRDFDNDLILRNLSN